MIIRILVALVASAALAGPARAALARAGMIERANLSPQQDAIFAEEVLLP